MVAFQQHRQEQNPIEREIVRAALEERHAPAGAGSLRNEEFHRKLAAAADQEKEHEARERTESLKAVVHSNVVTPGGVETAYAVVKEAAALAKSDSEKSGPATQASLESARQDLSHRRLQLGAALRFDVELEARNLEDAKEAVVEAQKVLHIKREAVEKFEATANEAKALEDKMRGASQLLVRGKNKVSDTGVLTLNVDGQQFDLENFPANARVGYQVFRNESGLQAAIFLPNTGHRMTRLSFQLESDNELALAG